MAGELNYSRLDRLLHRIAFSGTAVQLAAADVEKVLLASTFKDVRAERPIFITSLPRAGTTLMLEVLSRLPSLASHTYRDMPFVMAPVLWNRMSASFRQSAELQERAHGDGVKIGYDSPEAFEEILWRAFWPEKYTPSQISLWGESDYDADARNFFVQHMKKIVSLRRPERLRDGRYVSKNNANIARLPLIRRMFPDASVIIPIRHPLQQARSLLRQHRSFLALHRETPFIRRYMEDIGHYEFGASQRPIAFPKLDAFVAGRDALTLDYWIGYWIAAFEHVQATRGDALVVSYERLCLEGEDVVHRICRRFGVADEKGAMREAAAQIRTVSPQDDTDADVDPRLLERAGRIHAALLEHTAPEANETQLDRSP